MKQKISIVVALLLLVVTAAVYRLIPGRPFGFAPQIAMALFGGAVFVHNKKWAFALPVISMFLSDLLFQVLYSANLSTTPGFYEGQWQNYLLFALLTVIGFAVKKEKVLSIAAGTLVAPTVYFLLSNSLVWLSGGGYQRPKTFSGFIQCMNDGIPFYGGSVAATVVFGAVLFGGYYLIKKSQTATGHQMA
ncbi:DUF6580 family putative transport protein [Deminuibacter soli]|uniref:Uncharacterized protein n=1 Tax=Deminuibacter soli TaxID=2291815 RepID=A0A3E1NL15_9BACT|nr:DUF6580 family putative transport protein [Deminuibacter soli]RFM28612.1 hypothetical protein DXN05_07390 [Deminuibacter soli]